RRLSILDPTEAGAQPMERHGVVLLHNGEVYNYLELADELRAKGYTFSSGTDTEVILAAYDAWGLDAFARFNGMWAFVLWDRRRRRLVLSRDRLGVKPLYFRRTPRSIAVASEIPAILSAGPLDNHDSWRAEPDLTIVRDFLTRGLVDHSDRTFVSGIRSLPAAHSLVIEDGAQRLVRYWGPPTLSDDARARVGGADARRDESLLEEFRAIFDDSVRLRLRSDVPIGTCLSGGLDSSSIVATSTMILRRPRRHDAADATDHEQRPHIAFHARFPKLGVDESRYAEIVAASCGLELVFRSPDLTSVFDAMSPILRAQGEPFGGTSVMAQFAVMEAAHSRGLKVMLDGQGGDELLAGYLPYLGYRTASLVRSGSLRAVAGELRDQVRWGSLDASSALVATVRGLSPVGVVETIRARSGGRHGIRVSDELNRHGTAAVEHHEPGTPLARRLWQDVVSESLPALLRYEDRNSMAFSIEARVPFLDVRLVELTLRLPDRMKITSGMTKAVLRRAMAGRVPAEVLDRRDKVGFATPQLAWLSQARPELERHLVAGQVVRRGWMTRQEIGRLLDQLTPGGRTHEQLWRAAVLEAWLDQLELGLPRPMDRLPAREAATTVAS
ncbi:MAG TPA: asparagine synthase (glutamine-hydrolyzing), partial [Candidatus Limnocylindrales bacterium]|nr:asparagine synthase (glutamine-hydrolyzing) [Candidatus Limnocylindrales bacterium]